MLSKYGRGWIAAPLSHIAGWLEKTGISPNALTAIGFLLSLAVAAVLAAGNLLIGGLLLIFAALFDTLDGALARHAGKTTVFGAFFDSVMVMCEDAALQQNRLALLQQLRGLFLEVADISYLVPAKN